MTRKVRIAGYITIAFALPLLIAATTGGFPSRPRFTAVAIGAPNSGLATGELYAIGTIGTDSSVVAFAGLETDEGGLFVSGDGDVPSLTLNDETSSASNRRWRVTPSSDRLRIQVCNDTASSCSDVLTVDRTANTVDSINLQAASVQVNGSTIGQSAIGGVLTSVSTADVSRTSTTTRTCQTDLTISGLQSTGYYAIEAHIEWDQSGSAANGLRIGIDTGGTGGTILMESNQFVQTVNTSTGNVAPLAQNLDTVAGVFTYTHSGAQVLELHMVGTLNISAVTSPTVCVSWAQAASNATGTRVRRGSWIKATRLS